MLKLPNRIRIGSFLYHLEVAIIVTLIIVFLGGAVASQYPATEEWINSEILKIGIKILVNLFFYSGILLSIVIVSLFFEKSYKNKNRTKFVYLGLLILLPSISAPLVFRSLVGNINLDPEKNPQISKKI